MSSNNNAEFEGSYELPRNMEIAEIKNVYDEMQVFMGKTYEKFVLDAGSVALIDTSGIQLLIQLVRSLKASGCVVFWVNDSIQIYQMAAELGLVDELED